MTRDRFSAEQIFRMLREAEVHLSAGQERKVLLVDGWGKGCTCGTAVVKGTILRPRRICRHFFRGLFLIKARS
jgi:hypothetical protein